MELNRIYNQDCIDGMAGIPDKSIDCVVCDLPYYNVVSADFDRQWSCEEDYLGWVQRVITEYKRILKDNGNLFLFTSRQFNRTICGMLDKLFTEKRIIIWCRKRGFNQTRGHALASGYEPIAYYCNGDKGTFNNIKVKVDSKRPEYTKGTLKDGITLSDVWSDIPALPHNAKEKTAHPTQKPYRLIERIVLLGTDEGDTVLDNCMGSGTTAVVCRDLGRNFIGFENNGEYFRIAQERLNSGF